MKNNSCIDKDYGVWGSKVLANLSSLSSDLAVCARNYENDLQDLTEKLKNGYHFVVPKPTIEDEETTPKADCHCKVPKNHSTHLLIIIAVTSGLSIIGTIAVVIFIFKTKKVLKQKAESQDMELQKMDGSHYYSKPDTPAQIEHAQWEQLRQELREENQTQ
jgi:hypothetical protein